MKLYFIMITLSPLLWVSPFLFSGVTRRPLNSPVRKASFLCFLIGFVIFIDVQMKMARFVRPADFHYGAIICVLLTDALPTFLIMGALYSKQAKRIKEGLLK